MACILRKWQPFWSEVMDQKYKHTKIAHKIGAKKRHSLNFN